MQLETMQYFDETMSGAPDPATATPADVLKWALIDEKAVEYKSYDATLNQITFEEKHGMTEHTIYTFSDKTSRIRSFIDIIDEKTVQVVRNIMHLQDFEISIESEKYSYVNNGSEHRFTQASSGIGLEFGSSELIVAQNGKHSYTKYIDEFDRYRVLVSEDSLLVVFEKSKKWIGYLISTNRSRNGTVTLRFTNTMHSRYINAKGSVTYTNTYTFSHIYGTDDLPKFNQLNARDVFEVLPCYSSSTEATYPRVLSSFYVGKQEQSETVFYANDTRIFMWETATNQAILLAVGGRDVTAFK